MPSALIVTFESEEVLFIELSIGLLLTSSTIVATMYTSISLVNQPVFSGLRMRARKGEGEGKEKTCAIRKKRAGSRDYTSMSMP